MAVTREWVEERLDFAFDASFPEEFIDNIETICELAWDDGYDHGHNAGTDEADDRYEEGYTAGKATIIDRFEEKLETLIYDARSDL